MTADLYSTGAGRGTLLHAGRALRHARRTPALVVQSLLFPTLLLVVFQLVFARSLETVAPDRDAADLAALLVLVATVFGALAGGNELVDEREHGLLARFAVLPVHRFTVLLGWVLAELVRVEVSALVLMLVAALFGMALPAGPAGVMAFFMVLAVVSVAVGVLVAALAVASASRAVLNLLAPVFLMLMFFSSGFAPLSSFPAVLRPVVEFLPFTVGVDTLLFCLRGGAFPLLAVLTLVAWLLVALGVAAWLWSTRAAARISGEAS